MHPPAAKEPLLLSEAAQTLGRCQVLRLEVVVEADEGGAEDTEKERN